MEFKEKEVLINSFVYANFNMAFSSAKSVTKIQQIQRRALRILYNDFDSDYKTLLDKSGKCAMEVKRVRTLRLQVF